MSVWFTLIKYDLFKSYITGYMLLNKYAHFYYSAIWGHSFC
jgi:hypothetical protein